MPLRRTAQRTVHIPLSPLYMTDYAGLLADEILLRAREHHLTTDEIVYFQDRIASANRHGKIDNKQATRLFMELHHWAHGTELPPVKKRRFRSSKRRRA